MRRNGTSKRVPTADFNPRTPVGCDPDSHTVTASGSIFQSTHPSGVRPGDGVVSFYCQDFNPRTPVGCDFLFKPTAGEGTYFNPRTPVGCDVIGAVAAIIVTLNISIHAPQWGATDRMI